MAWTYPQLKAAIAALSPTPSSLSATAAAINAQTVAAGYQDVPLGSIQGILLLSGDWLKIEARAASAASGATPPTAADNAIPVAMSAVALVVGKADVVHAADFPAFATLMAVLVASGDVSTGSQAAIAALAQPSFTLPKWQPPVNAGDIQTAEAS